MKERNEKDQFSVVHRNCEPWEPAWVVYKGRVEASAVAHFFNLSEAKEYAESLNVIERHKPKAKSHAKKV